MINGERGAGHGHVERRGVAPGLRRADGGPRSRSGAAALYSIPFAIGHGSAHRALCRGGSLRCVRAPAAGRACQGTGTPCATRRPSDATDTARGRAMASVMRVHVSAYLQTSDFLREGATQPTPRPRLTSVTGSKMWPVTRHSVTLIESRQPTALPGSARFAWPPTWWRRGPLHDPPRTALYALVVRGAANGVHRQGGGMASAPGAGCPPPRSPRRSRPSRCTCAAAACWRPSPTALLAVFNTPF
jgi:hypothetical protein